MEPASQPTLCADCPGTIPSSRNVT